MLEHFLISEFAFYLVQDDNYKLDLKQVRKDFDSLELQRFLNKYSNIAEGKLQVPWHRNWFNFNRLRKLLREVNFRKIEKATFQRSRFKEMNNQEFDRSPSLSIFVECEKRKGPQ